MSQSKLRDRAARAWRDEAGSASWHRWKLPYVEDRLSSGTLDRLRWRWVNAS